MAAESSRYRELTRSNWKGLAIKSRSQAHTLKTGNRQDNREAGERGDRNESPDAHAVHTEILRLTKLEQQGQLSKCDHLALTGGWVCALGWVVLKLIERKFAEQPGQHHKRWRPSEHRA